MPSDRSSSGGLRRRRASGGSGARSRRSWTSTLAYASATAFLASLPPFADAASQSGQLYTSSTTLCSPQQAILVDRFDLHYYRQNETVTFDIIAASVEENLNVDVNIFLNAYGIDAVNMTVNLCTVAGGALCPLPQANFAGSGYFNVPAEFADKIPSLAYTVPDLEAVARVELLRTDTGEIAACMQTTLSNGHTVRKNAVSWGMGALALVALVSSLLHSMLPRSNGAAQWRIVDVLWYLQHVATTSLLSLNYPVVYQEFAANFGWSLGLLDIPSIQHSIDSTRNATGGNASDASLYDPNAYSNRKFSPYNLGSGASPSFASGGPSGLSFAAMASEGKGGGAHPVDFMAKSFAFTPNKLLSLSSGLGNSIGIGSSGLIGNTSSIPVVSENGTIPAGIPTFTSRLHIAPTNVFLTVLITFLMLLALGVGLFALIYVVVRAIAAGTTGKRTQPGLAGDLARWAERFSRPKEFGAFTLTYLARLVLVAYPPFLIFIFYQFTVHDSWLSIFLAAVLLAFLLAASALFAFPVVRSAHRFGAAALYHDKKVAPPAESSLLVKRWGGLSHPFRPKYYWFVAVLLLAAFIRACFIAFAQAYALRQVIGCLVVEALLFIAWIVCRPGRDRRSDALMLFLTFARMATWGICIAFVDTVGVRPLPRAIIGFVLLAVQSIVLVVIIFNTFWDLLYGVLLYRRSLAPEKASAAYEKDTEAYPYGQMAVEADTGGAGAGGEKRRSEVPSSHFSSSPRIPSAEGGESADGGGGGGGGEWSAHPRRDSDGLALMHEPSPGQAL